MLFKPVQERCVDSRYVCPRLHQDELEFGVHLDESPLRADGDSAELLVGDGEVLLVEEIVEGLVNSIEINQDDCLAQLNGENELFDDFVDVLLLEVEFEVAANQYSADASLLHDLRIDVGKRNLQEIGDDHNMSGKLLVLSEVR